jgi:hypothetical protein
MSWRIQWAMFAMGAWLAGSVLVSVVATQNFRTVDRLLDGSKNAAFSSAVGRIGHPAARDTLRYLSSELNRLYFGLWNVAQVILGVLVFWLISGGPASRARVVIAGMLAISLFMFVWLTPQVTSLGRSLDFVPREPPPPALRQFWILHGLYTSLELIKLLLGVVAAVWIGRAGGIR